MKATPRPARTMQSPEPAYPTLGEETQRRGLSRRGFLLTALAGSASALTGCPGAAPRPTYPQAPWREVPVGLPSPVTLTGCGGTEERETYGAVIVTTPLLGLVERLGTPAGQAAVRRIASQIAAEAACHHSTLAVQRRRAEARLGAEFLGWYRATTGAPAGPQDAVVRLRPLPPAPAARSVATD